MSDRELPYRVVDVFTRQRFAGNPAAVVLNADGLGEDRLQRIAAEFNLSETVFVLPPERDSQADIRLRWFTPEAEVRMCGHATLAAVHALIEFGRLPAAQSPDPVPVEIATIGGTLQAFADDQHVLWLDLVDPVLKPVASLSEDLVAALCLDRSLLVSAPPPIHTQDGDLLLFVRDAMTLQGLQPNFTALAEACRRARVRGVCVSTTVTLDPAIHVQSRFFAPACGINEDPVTGSVHGPLAAHLVACDHVQTLHDLAALCCAQGRPGDRAGIVQVFVQRQDEGRFAVRIGGPCVTSAAGVLYC